jgi:hypothetical protein
MPPASKENDPWFDGLFYRVRVDGAQPGEKICTTGSAKDFFNLLANP